MKTLIDQNWIPCDKTSGALKRKGFSAKQFNHVRRIFLRENYMMEVANANTVFTNMFKGMPGEDLPKPDNSKSEALDKKRQLDIDNKSDPSKAEEVRASEPGALSNEEAIAFYMKGRK